MKFVTYSVAAAILAIVAIGPVAEAGAVVDPCYNPTTPVQRLVCNTLDYVGDTIDYAEYVADEATDGAYYTVDETVEYANENCSYWTGRNCIPAILLDCNACEQILV
ncbi:MAG TPA: hypothetical protein VNZ52_02445 [Candidatus Thermoplasmatota archaeon]|nr:hypothetical protein [Candidatus Thermoplasmatota archaeon]